MLPSLVTSLLHNADELVLLRCYRRLPPFTTQMLSVNEVESGTNDILQDQRNLAAFCQKETGVLELDCSEEDPHSDQAYVR